MRPHLYLISPPQFELSAFRSQLEAALSACDTPFVGAFQLRLKEADDADITRAVRELLPICRTHNVAFILNDRPDLAAQLHCDGVHLGQEDLETTSIKNVRNIIGEQAAIGITCHASRHLAMEAGEQGADYVAFGAFFDTNSKPKEKLEKWGTPTPDLLTWWQEYMTLPCIAIGGITPDNCIPLAAAGADFIAVITAIWNHPAGATAAVRQFKEAIEKSTISSTFPVK